VSPDIVMRYPNAIPPRTSLVLKSVDPRLVDHRSDVFALRNPVASDEMLLAGKENDEVVGNPFSSDANVMFVVFQSHPGRYFIDHSEQLIRYLHR